MANAMLNPRRATTALFIASILYLPAAQSQTPVPTDTAQATVLNKVTVTATVATSTASSRSQRGGIGQPSTPAAVRQAITAASCAVTQAGMCTA